MKVTTSQIEDGVVAYLDHELMPLLPESGYQRVITGVALSLMIRKYRGKLEQMKSDPLLKTVGVITDEGDYDVDAIREELKKHLPADGLSMEIPILGNLTIKAEDVDKLYGYIEKVAR